MFIDVIHSVANPPCANANDVLSVFMFLSKGGYVEGYSFFLKKDSNSLILNVGEYMNVGQQIIMIKEDGCYQSMHSTSLCVRS